MIYPYEKYLTVLLIKGYDNVAILSKLGAVGSVPPPETEIDEKRKSVFGLLPKELVQHIYPPSRADYAALVSQYATQLSVLDIDEILPQLAGKRLKDWEDVLYICANIRIRHALQSLLLFGAPDDKIIEVMLSRYGYSITPSVLHMYRKYMWDTGRMTKLEIYTCIGNIQGATVRTQLMDAFHKREETVRWRTSGENVLTLEGMLKEVMNEAFFKFRESMSNAEPDNVHRVAKWADLAIKAAEKFDKLAKQSNDNLLSKLVFDLDKKSHENITKKDDVDGEIV